MIHRIHSNDVPDLWPLVVEHAEAAMQWHPFMDANDLLVVILHGHAQLFIVTSDKGAFLGFAAVEVILYPRCKVANVLAAGGHRGFLGVSVNNLFPELEKWAQEHDADTFAVQGRPGWLRIAERFVKGSKGMRIGVAWRPLAYERRRRGSNDPGIRAMEGGSAIPRGQLQ